MNNKYEVKLSKKAIKFMGKLDKKNKERIARELLSLSENPFVLSNVKKLNGHEYYRKRVGDFRIIFKVHDNTLIITIVDIGNRGEIYNRY